MIGDWENKDGKPSKVYGRFGVVRRGDCWFVAEVVTPQGHYIELPTVHESEGDACVAAGKLAARDFFVPKGTAVQPEATTS